MNDYYVKLSDGQGVEAAGITITAAQLPEIVVAGELVFRLAIRDTADGAHVYNLVANAVVLP
jgi:hypothetical protein